MNDNDPKDGKPGRGGWNSAPDYTPQSGFEGSLLFTLGVIILAVVITTVTIKRAKAEQVNADVLEITSIYFSDADSGRINGNIKFRLNNVDAPETGGVGAAIGGATCELERERGFASKEWIVAYTRDAELEITGQHGQDKYERRVIDLSVNGVDVGQAGIEAGYLKPWPHKGRRALVKKPDWCLKD